MKQGQSPGLPTAAALCCLWTGWVTILASMSSAQGAELNCTTDDDCTWLNGRPSICIDNFCGDPYERGCLFRRLGSLRVCNSHDPPEAASAGLCRTPSIVHLEVRLFTKDWESSIFQSWILQIILSELLDLPTSIETGRLDIDRSFYNVNTDIDEIDEEIRHNRITGMYPSFDNSVRLGDCRLASKFPGKYESCAHVAPETWETYSFVVEPWRPDLVESPRPTGALGRSALFVPKFTAERDPSLVSYLGLQGETNRRKMAETFLRPTTWKDYCDEVSPTNCTIPDSTAVRPPRDPKENGRFFFSGAFAGYFRKTWKNDCSSNQTKCTGHVADFPCGMSTHVIPQMYHLNIALEGDGPEPQSKGYARWQLRDIWRAANATKSNVLLYWWSPTALFEEFMGSDAEFTKVTFPIPTRKCLDSARRTVHQCSAVEKNRVGDKEATCEVPAEPLSMMITRNFHEQTLHAPEAIQSPAYDALSRYALSDLRLAEILDYSRDSKTPRRAVCEWVDKNLDFLRDMIVPPSHPRVLQEENFVALMCTAFAFGAIATLLVLWTTRETYLQLRKPIVRNAQVEFLYFVVAGSLFIALGSVLVAVPPSNSSCRAQIWFIHLGYTLSLVPQIVKVAAINRLMMAARHFHRMHLDLKSLYGAVVLISGFVIVFLVVWSLMDPPQKIVEYKLTDTLTSDGKTVVDVAYTCRSDADMWELVAISWNGLLLLCAVVLAIQTRSLRNDFNESQSLGNLIYANFVFLIFRSVAFFMISAVPVTALNHVRSIIFSLDVVTTVAVYFVPKFLANDSAPARGTSTTRSNKRRAWSTDFSNDLGPWSLQSPRLRSGNLGIGLQRQAELRIEIPPTNRFLRFLTGTSNITMFQADNSSEFVVNEGVKSEITSRHDEDDEEHTSGICPPHDTSALSEGKAAAESSDNMSSQTCGCDTMSEDPDKKCDKILLVAQQHEETIASLREEIRVLRRRLVKNDKRSSGSSQTTTVMCPCDTHDSTACDPC